MKILITGATGFIGQNLVSLLLKKDIEIFCLVRENSDCSTIHKEAKIITYNKKIDSLLEVFEKEKFDGVIHLASLFFIRT